MTLWMGILCGVALMGACSFSQAVHASERRAVGTTEAAAPGCVVATPETVAPGSMVVTPETVAPGSMVVTPETAVPGSTISPATGLAAEVDAVRERLVAACGCDSLRIEWRGFEALARAASELEQLESLTPHAAADSCPDRLTLRLRGTQAGRAREILLVGDILCPGEVFLASRTLRAGEILEARDVSRTRGWYPPSAHLAGEGSPVGLWTRNGIPRGRWISRAELREPPLVRKGERLRVVWDSEGFRLEAEGVARRDGWAGESVGVRLTGADRDCAGEVLSRGEVRIGSNGGGR